MFCSTSVLQREASIHPSTHPSILPTPAVCGQKQGYSLIQTEMELKDGNNSGNKRRTSEAADGESISDLQEAAAFIAVFFFSYLFKIKEPLIYVTFEASGFALRRPSVGSAVFL